MTAILTRAEREDALMGRDTVIDGPFGRSNLVLSVPTGDLVAAYRRKCGVDVSPWFGALSEIHLFECAETGYRFWRPGSIAGDEDFYKLLAEHWPDYYRSERWEYPFVRASLSRADRVLEVGCGRGFFLASLEGWIADALGLELNPEAIATKATRFEILRATIERLARERPNGFDVVCSFQVLEHVVEPRSFLEACVRCLRPGGILALSTPNYGAATLERREDAFDLPPHHMGHFSAAVYRRVAERLGLAVEAIEIEPRYPRLDEPIAPATRASLVYRAARRLSYAALALAYDVAREPGTNILAILRKPRQEPRF